MNDFDVGRTRVSRSKPLMVRSMESTSDRWFQGSQQQQISRDNFLDNDMNHSANWANQITLLVQSDRRSEYFVVSFFICVEELDQIMEKVGNLEIMGDLQKIMGRLLMFAPWIKMALLF